MERIEMSGLLKVGTNDFEQALRRSNGNHSQIAVRQEIGSSSKNSPLVKLIP
jgi:hypothetical protein